MERFNARINPMDTYAPTTIFKAFDFPKTPVITQTYPNQIQSFYWGLIPAWSKGKSIRKNTLNARIETLTERKSFKDIVQNRCLIIADGLYEWQWRNKSGSIKEKFLITLPEESLFSFAGLHTQWADANDTPINSYTIVTTAANELMSKIHNTKKRMPVVLKKEDEQNWLQGKDYTNFAFPYECKLKAISLDNASQLNLF